MLTFKFFRHKKALACARARLSAFVEHHGRQVELLLSTVVHIEVSKTVVGLCIAHGHNDVIERLNFAKGNVLHPFSGNDSATIIGLDDVEDVTQIDILFLALREHHDATASCAADRLHDAHELLGAGIKAKVNVLAILLAQRLILKELHGHFAGVIIKDDGNLESFETSMSLQIGHSDDDVMDLVDVLELDILGGTADSETNLLHDGIESDQRIFVRIFVLLGRVDCDAHTTLVQERPDDLLQFEGTGIVKKGPDAFGSCCCHFTIPPSLGKFSLYCASELLNGI